MPLEPLQGQPAGYKNASGQIGLDAIRRDAGTVALLASVAEALTEARNGSNGRKP